jgi:HD superfamily phosphodiesterase
MIKEFDATLLKIKPIEISSTKIRSGSSVEIPLRTKKYIAKNFLYIKNIVYGELTKERLNHSLLVGAIARQMAKIHKYRNLDEVYYAGIVHDITKEKTKE